MRNAPDLGVDAELKPKGEMFVVVQNGGSSAEWYANAFDTREDAQAFIDDCDKHTYNCIGPFALPSPPEEADWLNIIGEILNDAIMGEVAQPTEKKRRKNMVKK